MVQVRQLFNVLNICTNSVVLRLIAKLNDYQPPLSVDQELTSCRDANTRSSFRCVIA